MVRDQRRHTIHGQVGVCWDSAVVETFFSHLKTEFYHHRCYGSRRPARTAVMDYIESWYNSRRPSSRAGGSAQFTAAATYKTSSWNPWTPIQQQRKTVSKRTSAGGSKSSESQSPITATLRTPEAPLHLRSSTQATTIPFRRLPDAPAQELLCMFSQKAHMVLWIYRIS